ncbi:MAG TPA: hypothetical protein VK675_04500 [Candidatus Paceibacterota bacterium]|nr:hypothetical protein [Candidatus Paceibacterota bacterium]
MTLEELGCLVGNVHGARRVGDEETRASDEELEESRRLFLNLLDAIGKEKKITREDVQLLAPSTVLESDEVKIAATSLDEWLGRRMRKVHVIDCIGLAFSYQKYQKEKKSWLK